MEAATTAHSKTMAQPVRIVVELSSVSETVCSLPLRGTNVLGPTSSELVWTVGSDKITFGVALSWEGGEMEVDDNTKTSGSVVLFCSVDVEIIVTFEVSSTQTGQHSPGSLAFRSHSNGLQALE